MFAQRAFDRRRFFGTAALSIAAAWIGTRDSVLQLITVEPFRISGTRDLASLASATAWLNSAPLTAGDLRGKVVLVDFCTYTCINWLRTLPYGRAWAARYKEHGLVVLGVHTPTTHDEIAHWLASRITIRPDGEMMSGIEPPGVCASDFVT